MKKAILKIAYHDGTAKSVLDNTFVLDVLVIAKGMHKMEKAAYQKELEDGRVDDEIPQEGNSQQDIRPFVRVIACLPDHETIVTIGILGLVQKVIKHMAAKEIDRIDSHIVLLTIEISPFNFRCDNRDCISFGYVRRKTINEALTIAAYRDTQLGKIVSCIFGW